MLLMEQNWLVGDTTSQSVVISCRVSGDRMPGMLELLNWLRMKRKLVQMKFLAGTCFVSLVMVSVPMR